MKRGRGAVVSVSTDWFISGKDEAPAIASIITRRGLLGAIGAWNPLRPVVR